MFIFLFFFLKKKKVVDRDEERKKEARISSRCAFDASRHGTRRDIFVEEGALWLGRNVLVREERLVGKERSGWEGAISMNIYLAHDNSSRHTTNIRPKM